MYRLCVLIFLSSCLSSLHALNIDEKGCDEDVHGVCFVTSDDDASWEDAVARCVELGGELAVVEKSTLRQAMDRLLRRGIPLWIGLHELAVEGHPYWVNGNILGKHNGKRSYPWNEDDDNSDENDCVLAVPNAEIGQFLWQYANCQDTYRYLCGISDLDENARDKLKNEQDAIEAMRSTEMHSTFAIIEKENEVINFESKVIEGDIIPTPEQWNKLDQDSIRKRGVINDPAYLWPDGIVHYKYEVGKFTSDEIRMIEDAIETIQNATCIDFRPRQTEDHYVNITKDGGCRSYVGRVPVLQGQLLSLEEGCLYSIGVPIHEFLHALGFFHEQSRPDRDDFVEVNFDNIQEGKEHNFNVKPMTTQGVHYDYGSVMHYGLYAFAKDRTVPTLILKQEHNANVGQRNGLSAFDIDEINRIYDCKVPVDGNWSPWNAWTPCPVTCGGSVQLRTRQCNYPPPSIDPIGQPCYGDSVDTRICMSIQCPTDLDYSWLGCYWDVGNSELLTSLENTNNPYLTGNYWDRNNPVEKCAYAAASIGHDIFAIRFGGKCYSMSTAVDGLLYQEGGESSECYDGTGTTDSIDVYSVQALQGRWGEWSQWSVCNTASSPCLADIRRGQRTRYRSCETGICQGEDAEIEDCQETCESQDKWLCIDTDLFVFVIDNLLSWEQARTHCESIAPSFQSDLVVMADYTIHVQIQNFIASEQSLHNPPKRGYWTGCDDIDEEGNFVWVNGAPVDMETTSWWRNEPNNNTKRCRNTGQDCCQLWQKRRTTLQFNLDDDCCSKEKGSVCQIRNYCHQL
ncbi:zinc metalloproteinase dpy-31-like [Ptychodera flava]|uniref:zinc metalloproteinase dpy-31-like n=1 Tax=Ptychodera flava TaxID=63121 RepID=UPI00396A2808